MNVNLSVLPVEQNMPIATAELNFHEYVLCVNCYTVSFESFTSLAPVMS